MSWDALIFNGTGVPKSLSSAPQDWTPPPLGDPRAIREELSASIPQIEWVPDRDYGAVETNEFAIEFRVPDELPLKAITIRIVGGGDPIALLVALCKEKGWVIFDNQVGDLMNLDGDPAESWRKFKEWRDRTV
jgi:hypothetical protein